MCTQETPSQLSAQLKAALAKQGTQQAELQAALAREATLRGTEQDFRLLQEERFAKLAVDYLQEQVRNCHQAAGLDSLSMHVLQSAAICAATLEASFSYLCGIKVSHIEGHNDNGGYI